MSDTTNGRDEFTPDPGLLRLLRNTDVERSGPLQHLRSGGNAMTRTAVTRTAPHIILSDRTRIELTGDDHDNAGLRLVNHHMAGTETVATIGIDTAWMRADDIASIIGHIDRLRLVLIDAQDRAIKAEADDQAACIAARVGRGAL